MNLFPYMWWRLNFHKRFLANFFLCILLTGSIYGQQVPKNSFPDFSLPKKLTTTAQTPAASGAPVTLTIWTGVKIMTVYAQKQKSSGGLMWEMTGTAVLDVFIVTDQDGKVQDTSYATGELVGWEAYGEDHWNNLTMVEEITPASRKIHIKYSGSITNDNQLNLGMDFAEMDDTNDTFDVRPSHFPYPIKSKKGFITSWGPSMMHLAGGRFNLDIQDNGAQGDIATISSTGGNNNPFSFGMATVDMVITTGPFSISLIEPQLFGTFIQDQSIENKLKTYVDWKGKKPSEIDYYLKKLEESVEADSEGGEHIYDMGALEASEGSGGNNRLKTIAEALSGSRTLPDFRQIDCVPVPAWGQALSIADWAVATAGNEAIYRFKLSFPAMPFEGTVTMPSFFPYIGGNPIGLLESQVNLKAYLTSMGTGTAEGDGKTGFTAAGTDIEGEIKGKGNFGLSKNGLKLTGGEVSIDLTGKISAEKNLFDLAPGLKGLIEKTGPFADSLMRFGNVVKVKAFIGPTVGLGGSFKQQGDSVDWTSGKGSIGITEGVESSAGDENAFLLTVGGSGTGKMHLKLPPPVYDSFTIDLQLYFKLAYMGQHLLNESTKWTYPGGAGDPTRSIHSNETAIWAPMVYEVAHDKPFAQWDARPFDQSSLRSIRVAERGTSTSWELMTNLNTDASPALAASESKQLALAWILEDMTKPADQRREVWTSICTGNTWEAPTRLTSDTLDAFNPRIIYDGEGNTIAIWEGPSNPSIRPSEPFDSAYLATWDIWWSRRDSLTGTWSIPATLSNNTLMDSAPNLARLDNGRTVAAWLAAATDAPSPTIAIWVSEWNGTIWSTPAQITSANGIGAISLAAPGNGETAFIAFDRDMDNDVETVDDVEIFSIERGAAGWGTATRVTNDTLFDLAPRLVCSSTGAPLGVWYRDGDLVLTDLQSGTIQMLMPDQGSLVLQQLRCAALPNDNLLLTWLGYSDSRPQIMRKAVSLASPQKGETLPLTNHSTALESSPAIAVNTNGDKVAVAYLSTAIHDTGTSISYAETDLLVLERALMPDFAFDETEPIRLAEENPVPGEKTQVTITVWNHGDVTYDGNALTVEIWDGEPDTSGARRIKVPTLTTPFAPATSQSVTVDWNVPSSDSAHRVFAIIDRFTKVDEINEENNSTHINAILPDMAIESFVTNFIPGGDVEFTATIANLGVVSTSSTFTLTVDNPCSGTHRIRPIDVPFSLAPGERYTTITRMTEFHFTERATSMTQVMLSSINSPPETELTLTNNLALAPVISLPDLYLNARYLIITPPAIPGGTSHIRIYLWNFGSWQAPADARVRLYDNDIYTGGQQLAELVTTEPIAPGRFDILETDVVMDEDWSLYMTADPTNEIQEVDEGNNEAFSAYSLPLPVKFSVRGAIWMLH